MVGELELGGEEGMDEWGWVRDERGRLDAAWMIGGEEVESGGTGRYSEEDRERTIDGGSIWRKQGGRRGRVSSLFLSSEVLFEREAYL